MPPKGLAYPRDPNRSAADILWYLVLAALSVYAFSFLRFSITLIRYPFDWVEAEGNVLLAVRLLESGRPIYEDPGRFPMLPDIFPPLYPGVVFLLTRLFGTSIGVARAVSVATTLGLSCLIFRMARRSGAPPVLSLVAALLLFTFPEAAKEFALARPDALFLLLLTAGYFSVPWALEPESSLWRVSAPVLLFLGAALTKHPGLPAALVAAVAMLLSDRTRGGVFASGFFLLFALTAGLVHWWSHGWYYHDVYGFAAIFSRDWPIEADRVRMIFFPFLESFGLPIAVSLAVMAGTKPWPRRLAWPLFLVFGVAWSLQSGRNGLAQNHCLPGAVTASAAFGSSYGAKRPGTWNPFGLRIPVAALVPAMFLLSILVPVGELRVFHGPTETDRLAWSHVRDFIRSAPGPVLVDYAPSVAVESGKWQFASDSVNLYFGAEDSRELSTLVPLVLDRRFAGMVLFEHTFLPEELKELIRRNYRLREIIPVWTADPDTRRYMLLIVPKA